MKTISAIFLTGLAVLLPVVVTISLLYWLIMTTERFLANLLQFVLPEQLYWPGFGLVFAFAVIFGAGLLMRAWIVRRVFQWGEDIVRRIPLVKTVYGAVRDFMKFISNMKQNQFSKVVVVEFGDPAVKIIGFVTREDLSELPEHIAGDDLIAVYMPLSYQIGGYTAMLPRSTITPLDMTMEDAMRFTLTAGMSGSQQKTE
ncbi:MAG: DUF502 domain-containing protein [Gammaproteobacteria bacterium]|nr:DUF502 domain-containing protein [Gammaproteobacteria bacterium]